MSPSSVSTAHERRDFRLLPGMYVRQALLYLVLVGFGIIFAVPLLWLASSSLKLESMIYTYRLEFIPKPVDWHNFVEAVTDFPFWRSLWNTMRIVLIVMVGNLLTCSFTAYIFARIRFPGRDAIFLVVLGTMMIPYHVYLIPQYILFRNLGWLNSIKPLVVPSLFAQSAFFLFLLRQFLRGIPFDYDEAAMIDGCGRFGIYWRIILPQSLPVLGTMAILTFMGQWNDFLAPLIYLNEPEKQTLAVALRTWEALSSQPNMRIEMTVIMAVSVLITIPPMLLFFFAQRHFIQGIVISGVKG